MENGEKVREKIYLFIFVFNWSDFKLVGLKCFLTFFSTGLTKMFFPQIGNKIREKKWNKGVDQKILELQRSNGFSFPPWFLSSFVTHLFRLKDKVCINQYIIA